MKAPKIAGIESKKENSPAVSLLIFAKREAEIVIPLLEIPGKVPSPWANPTKRPCFTDILLNSVEFSSFCSFSLTLLEKINKNAVIIKPTKINFIGKSGKNLLAKIPMIPVTNVPTKIATIIESSIESSGLVFLVIHLPKTQSKDQIRFLKTKITASKVAKCKQTSKTKGSSSPKRFCTTARCPELEIGRNSAIPCKIPKTNA